MEIERTLREAFAMREAPADFEEVVMARVSAAAWRAGQRGSRGLRRIVLLGAVLVVVSAAAMLVAWRAESPNEPQQAVAQPVMTALPPPVVQEASPRAPAMGPQHPPASEHPPASGSTSANDICAAAEATHAPSVYSVLVQPLQFETDDPAIRQSVREYYDAMLEQLQTIPGLALAGSGVKIGAGPADYRVTLVGLPGMRETPLLPWRIKLLVEKWSGSSFVMFTENTVTGDSTRCLRLDDAASTSAHYENCRPAELPRIHVTRLQLPSYPTAEQSACIRARSTGPLPLPLVVSTALARDSIDRLAGKDPIARMNVLNMLRNRAKPEMVPELAAALRDSTDEPFRSDVITLLAAKFPDDPAAREALAAVATTSPRTLQGHVAQRVLTGEGPWRDYTIASIRDASLPVAKRLEPLAWMVEAMTLEPANEASAIDLLATLQQEGGAHALSQLLAGVVQRGVDGGMATFQQGQLVMRKLGALKHPAAVALLIDCFEAMPNGTSLNILASRRDDPRVVAKLESIAADPSDPSLAKRATTLLAQPSSPPMGASGGPTFVPAGGQFGQPFGQPLPPAPGK